ncbi:MAG TPA: TIGR02281 family clan AA aspartic protease [Allosphingosinicella sp.]|nr:TIGR02281 family clan AA aspartic protease [Allosphingosinicella sp.]
MSAGNGLVFAGLALIGVGLLSPVLRSGEKPAAAGNETDAVANTVSRPGRISSADPVSLPSPRELRRGPDGHFYADAQVNGATIRFMVDTGASWVVLRAEDAQRAGIQLPAERSLAMGVGGPVEVVPVTLERIAIGGIEARGVQAAVAEELPVSLLGQSYLSRLGSVEIRGDTMVLR